MLKTTGAFMMCLLLVSCSGTKLTGPGVKDGQLAPCPGSPNCVSTRAQDEKHRMDPIRYTGTKEQAHLRLVKVITSMPRTKIVTDRGDYLHVVFTSRLFRFRDDVEFVLDDAEKLIHFRSASRLGYSDLGVNRKRMEEIGKRFAKTTLP